MASRAAFSRLAAKAAPSSPELCGTRRATGTDRVVSNGVPESTGASQAARAASPRKTDGAAQDLAAKAQEKQPWRLSSLPEVVATLCRTRTHVNRITALTEGGGKVLPPRRAVLYMVATPIGNAPRHHPCARSTCWPPPTCWRPKTPARRGG